jgi:diguanylate cyclase (GGDEF)-like protein/PAS domain S-box-containing protein
MADSASHDVHRLVLEALPLGVYLLNREGRVTLWTTGAERLTGHLRQDVLGRFREADLIEPAAAGDVANVSGVESLSPPQSRPSTLVSLRCKNGHYLAVELRTISLRDEAGKVLGTVRIFEPSSTPSFCNHRQNKLGAYGCLDPVTGVLNHSMIQAHLRESLNLHALYPVPFSVLCYEVDDVSKLAARYGQAAVDAALRRVANAFETGLRPTDFVGRWMGQEFLAILPECGEGDVMNVAERLTKLAQHSTVEWWGDTLHLTVSVGAAVVHDNDSVSSVIARAEQGLRRSIAGGGNRLTVSLPNIEEI